MSSVTLPIVNNELKVKAVTYKSKYAPLAIKEISIPITPGSIVKQNELLVQVKATSLNPLDCLMKNFNRGWLGDRVLGCDFAGVVIKAGSNTVFKEGEEIYGSFMEVFQRGTFSEYILFDPSTSLVCEKIPNGMSFEEASSMPMVSCTAYQCFQFYKGDLKDKKVLILGAGSSVGSYAVQLAKHYFNVGTVIGTCSPRSSDKVLKLGADGFVDYTKDDTSKINELLEFVKINGKFDIIIDVVRDEIIIDYFDSLLKTFKENGVFVTVNGPYTDDFKNIGLIDVLPSFRRVKQYTKYALGLSNYKAETEIVHSSDTFGEVIAKLYKERGLNFSINSVRDIYSDFQEGYDLIEGGKVGGKVVFKW